MKTWLILSLCLGLVAGAAFAVSAYTDYEWNHQDYRGDARRVIDRQLRAAHPGYRPDLVVRMYGQDKTSRDTCIYELDSKKIVVNIWAVLYTKGIPFPVMHQEYTPNWTKIGGVEGLCLRYAAEPPPPHAGYGFPSPPPDDPRLVGPAAQSLGPTR